MNGKDISKDVLNKVNKKLAKPVGLKDIQKLASGVKPSTVQDEAQLRQLIKQVSDMVNAPVSEKTTNEIVKAVKASGRALGNLQQLMQMILNKK